MKIVRRLATFLFLGICAPHAAQHWTGPVEITDIYVWDYAAAGNVNYVNVRVSPFYNPDNCTDTQGYQLVSGSDSKSFERIYSILLAAYTAGKKVSLMIDGCNPKPVLKVVSFQQAKN